MSQLYAIIDAGVVVNTIIGIPAPDWTPPGGEGIVPIPDGNIVGIGYTYAGGIFTAPIPPTPTLSQAQATQTSTLSVACQAEILAGFSSSALGSAYNYPSDNVTQRNIAMAVISGGSLWCETGSTWAFETHTAAQAAQVQKDLWAMIQAAQAKYSTLLAEVDAATTVAAVQAIVW